jgi:hypothetical protein
MPPSRSSLPFGCLALVIVACFFRAPLLRDLQFHHSDVHALIYPLKELMAGELRQGRLPVWDPHSLCGYPLIASYVSAVFLPQNVLYLVLPFDFAFKLIIVLKHLTGSLFQFLLLRRLGLSPLASLGGAVLFGLSGPFLSLSAFHAFAPECLPLMLWLWWRAACEPPPERRARLRRWIAAVLGFALAFLHGDLQTFQAGALLALLLPLAAEPGRRLPLAGAAASWACAAAFSLLVAAAQLLPAAELLPESNRAALAAEERLAHSLAVEGLAETAWPEPAASARSGDFVAFKYLGLGGFLLAAASLVLPLARGRSWRLSGFFSVTFGAALLLALGDNVPFLEPLSSAVPGLKLFRYPQKWLMLAAFALSVLAAAGVFELERLRLRPLAAVLAALALGDLFLAGGPFLERRLVSTAVYAKEILPRIDELPGGPGAHDRLLRLPTNGAFASAELEKLVLYEEAQGRPSRDLLIAWNIQTLLGNNASRAGVRQVGGISSFSFRISERLWQEAARRGKVARLADLLAARWIFTTPEDAARFRGRPGLDGLLPESPPAASRRSELGLIEFHRRPTALPRAAIVPAAVTAGEEEALGILFADDFDPRRLVVLAGAPARPAPDELFRTGSRDAAGTVEIIEDGLDRIVLEVESAAGGWLLLNDSYDRGWKAEVGGRPAPVFRANLQARAVAVPAGRTRIAMRYDPTSLRWGLAVSVLSLLALGALWRGGTPPAARRGLPAIQWERGDCETERRRE